MTHFINIIRTDISDIGDGTDCIMAYDSEGREYTLLTPDGDIRTFAYARDARRLEAKVAAKGQINADLWACRAPYGTLAWLIDGEEQRQIEDERWG